MKWREFRELDPWIRRGIRRSQNLLRLSQNKFVEKALKKLPHTDFTKYPEIKRVCLILPLFQSFKTPEEREELLKTPVITGDGEKSPFHLELMKTGILYPETVFGFFDGGQFIPGILPIFMRPMRLFADKLEEVLCLEDLSGKTVGQVVAMAKNAGMTDVGLNNARVRQRISYWDKGNGESFFNFMLTMSGKDPIEMRKTLLALFHEEELSQTELNEIIVKYVSTEGK